MRSALLAFWAGLVVTATPATAQVAREIPLPRTAAPAGVAVALDGAVWVSVMHADRVLRYDPESARFSEFSLPSQTLPRALAVDRQDHVWIAASARGALLRFSRDGSKPVEFALPSIMSARAAAPTPWALAFSARSGEVWASVQSAGIVARVDATAQPVRKGFVVREVKLGDARSRLDGIGVDTSGAVWLAEMGHDRLVRLDPATGAARIFALPPGSRPRGVATSVDGAVWVTLFGSHELMRVDTVSFAMRTWPTPSGPRSYPYAVAVDRVGHVWVGEYGACTVVRFDPRRNRFVSFSLPTPRTRVTALAADPRGPMWYVGTFTPSLGMIQ